MTDINKLIAEIIPYPANRNNRDGFSNDHIIDKLSSDEKIEVENALIDKLSEHPEDTLIVETLAYMKSIKSIPILMNLLRNSSNEMSKLIIASSIYEINQDNGMVDIATNAFRKLDDNKDAYYTYKLISAFFYLVKFRNQEVNEMIRKYINHKEYLVSYNAKRAVGVKK